MNALPDLVAAENKRLQLCINDLVSVVALPAMWVGGEPSKIVCSLLESLSEMLSLNFAYVRLNDPIGDAPRESCWSATTSDVPVRPEEVGALLRPWIGAEPRDWPPCLKRGNDEISIVPLRLGLKGEIGVLVVGAQRADFPQKTERLLLGVAANQATIGLQSAQILAEQKRIAGELDRRAVLAEEGLRSRDFILNAIVDSIAAPLSLWNPSGEAEVMNRPLLDYFGRTFDELKDRKRTLHPEDCSASLARWAGALELGQPFEEEARFLHAGGSYRWNHLRGFPIHDEEGRIALWCLLQTDIHDRRQTEEALAKSERSLNLTINSIPAMVWSANSNGNVDFFNRHFIEYVNQPLEQLRGGTWKDAIHPDDVAQVLGTWKTIMGMGRAGGEVEARLRRHDGSYRWFLMRVHPLHDEAANVVRWYGVNTDIEDRKRAEDALRDTQSELAHLTRAMTMGQLTASIAHEINQPLAGIITNAGTCLRMLGTDPPNVDGARETARRTIRDGNRASEVIARLRALFSRRAPTLEEVDINGATQEIIALTLKELQKKGVTLRVDLADDLPLIFVDRVQLQQVILNLVMNAAEAMQDIAERQKALEITTGRDGSDHVRLSVRDAGVGLDAGAIEKLFNPFYTTKSGGMGIGLSVSRSIVETHRGTLWAEANDGPGATFSFRIPCDPPTPGGPNVAAPIVPRPTESP